MSGGAADRGSSAPIGLDRAAELARAFDRAFAEPVREATDDREHLLAFRLAGDPYVVRLAEVRGLLARQRIIPLPGPVPALLGIIGRRGGIVPVYSLRALLGAAAGIQVAAPVDPLAWVLLADGEGAAVNADTGGALIGLAFDGFDGTLRVPPGDVAPSPGGARGGHVTEVVRVDDALRGLVSLRSITITVQKWAGAGGSTAPENKES